MKVGQVWKLKEHVIKETCSQDFENKLDWEIDWIMNSMAQARFKIMKIEDFHGIKKQLLHVENFGEEILGEFKFTITPEAFESQFQLDESWS